MPPSCSEQRCSRYIGRRSRASKAITRPRLLTGESLDNADDEAEDSEENISPDAEKSEIRFTLGRRQDRDNNGNSNGGNNRDGGRRGQNRSAGDNNQGRQNGREGDSSGPGSRFPGGKDGPPGFSQKDGGEIKPTDNPSGDGIGKGDRGGDKGGNNRGDDNKGNDGKGNRGGVNTGGDGKGNNNGGGGGNNNGNRGGGDGNGGRGGGGSGDNRGGSGSGSDNSSSSSPPPPPSSTTTTESTTTDVSTTTSVSSTTTAVVSTSTPPPETTTTTSSSVIETNSIPTLTPLPALADIVPTSIVPPNPSAPDGAPGITQTPTSVSATDIIDSTTPAPTQTTTKPTNGFPFFGSGNGRHHGIGDNNNNNNKGNDKQGGLNPTSERILVAAGGIGVFIVLCFVGWMIYRTWKPKQSDHQNSGKSWLSKLIPWRRRSIESTTQASSYSSDPKELLPAYDFGSNNSMEAFGYYDQGKFYPLGPEGITYQPTATLQNGRVVWQTPEVQVPQASLQNQYPQASDQTMDISDVNSTMRSRMPDPYYNQSEFARQPSDAYNPTQRQVYRASEISSLSSGFGDGDIIMPPPNIPPNVPPKPPVAQVTNNADTNNRPFSWMSAAQTGTEKKRETVSTTISERPARFRSVNSWVDQQKERIRRANSRARAREEVPALPGQISYK